MTAIEQSDPLHATLVQCLRNLMSDISEECWCSGWEGNTEYALWEIVITDTPYWGDALLLPSQSLDLRNLSEAIGGWCDYEGFVPLDVWQERFRRYQEGER